MRSFSAATGQCQHSIHEPTHKQAKYVHHSTTMGVDHGGSGEGESPPQNLEQGDCPPQILSCCKILSTRLLALQCRKMCFCLYSRTFIVSPAMRPPPQNSSQIYAYVHNCRLLGMDALTTLDS